jgi:4-amino-4-deoxy-L-arabinose transferase-like glycosyltransferase
MAYGSFQVIRRWSLLIVFVLAFVVRLVGNTQVPSSPYWEETAVGYDAYSILKTGKDHHGEAWPIVAFRSFGDYKPSLYFYATVPSVAAFGLNTFAVRFPAVLASSLTAVLLFWLARRWRSDRFAWLTATLAIFQPWMWQVGRVGFEVNLAIMLCCLGVVLIHLAYDNEKNSTRFSLAGLATLAFVGAMYAYHGTRLLAPLFAFSSAFFLWEWPKKLRLKDAVTWLQFWIPAGALALALCLPLIIALRSPVIAQRFQETSIFGTDIANQSSVATRALSPGNVFVKVASHPMIIWSQVLAKNYLDHFDPSWLFIKGDYNPRHSSQYLGMLYPWEIFTLLFGIAFAGKLLKRKHIHLLTTLTLLSPLAAMLTTVTPHGLRALPLAPWLALWSALGAEMLIFESLPLLFKKVPWLKTSKAWIVIFGIGVLGSFGLLAYYMATQYQAQTATEWQFGYSEIIRSLKKHQLPGETLHLSRAYGRPAMYMWFTEKVEPQRVQAQEAVAQFDQGEFLTFEDWTFFDGQWSGGGVAAAPLELLPEGKTVLETIAISNERDWVIYR